MGLSPLPPSFFCLKSSLRHSITPLLPSVDPLVAAAAALALQ